jgi:hypothetical protein
MATDLLVERRKRGDLMKTLFVLLGLSILAAAALPQGGQIIPFKFLDRGSYSGVKEVGKRDFRTERGFEEFLASLNYGDRAKKYLRQVDWQAEQVVVVFGGERPTGGYEVEVKKAVRLNPQTIQIEAKLVKPRPGVMTTQAFTTPYMIIRMPRQVATIEIKFSTD